MTAADGSHGSSSPRAKSASRVATGATPGSTRTRPDGTIHRAPRPRTLANDVADPVARPRVVRLDGLGAAVHLSIGVLPGGSYPAGGVPFQLGDLRLRATEDAPLRTIVAAFREPFVGAYDWSSGRLRVFEMVAGRLVEVESGVVVPEATVFAIADRRV